MEIYIWGTGCGASEVVERGLSLSRITAFIDSSPLRESFLGRPVLRPDALQGRQPDLILVATRYADAVAKKCRALGISDTCILYVKEHNMLYNRNDRCTRAAEILGEALLSAIIPEQHLVTEPSSLRTPVLRNGNDYIRISVLELLSRRIQSVPGALAELGVYKGGFASCMNRLMPKRKLYLFDTFEGFGREEGVQEMRRGTCREAFLAAHQNTAADQVMQAMPVPRTVILKPGLFPGSLNGLEERFALVSLDADFRESTLEGLRYFWPRLNTGGYLMLHDWGDPKLTGVAEALELYQHEVGTLLPGVPIPDIGNSMILHKVSEH